MEQIRKVVTEHFEAGNWECFYTDDKDAYNKCLFNDDKKQDDHEYEKYKLIKNIESFCKAIKSGTIYVYKNGTRFNSCVIVYFNLEGNSVWKECFSPGYELKITCMPLNQLLFIKKFDGEQPEKISLSSIHEITIKLLEIYERYVLSKDHIVIINRIVVSDKINLQSARKFFLECKELYKDKI